MKSRHSSTAHDPVRRRVLAGLLAAPLATSAWAAVPAAPRALTFSHTHTGERLTAEYFDGRRYAPDALAELNHLLRDFRTDELHPIDPAVFDFVYDIQSLVGSTGTIEIISAYRSPATNEMLRQTSSGVAKKSYHMKGQALDIRLTDTSTQTARRAANQLQRGGVGYYAGSDFMHVDAGPTRAW